MTSCSSLLSSEVSRACSTRVELRPQRIELLVEDGDLIALARAERAVLVQRRLAALVRGLGGKVESLHLGKADLPLFQRALGEHRALLLVGEPGFELHRRVAERRKVGAHGRGLVLALAELAPALDQRRGHHAHLGFEVSAHQPQRVDVAAQALELGEHDLDLLLTGLGPDRRLGCLRHRGLPFAPVISLRRSCSVSRSPVTIESSAMSWSRTESED